MAYFGIFTCKKDIINEFSYSWRGSNERVVDEIQNSKILLAWYDIDHYDGDAFVLFERDGQLYEVHGAHCSCYGLEDQWQPEATTVAALRYRMQHGDVGYRYARDTKVIDVALKKILTRWERKHSE